MVFRETGFQGGGQGDIRGHFPGRGEASAGMRMSPAWSSDDRGELAAID
jgi:hypothetical protein